MQVIQFLLAIIVKLTLVEARCGEHSIETIYGSGNNKATVTAFKYDIINTIKPKGSQKSRIVVSIIHKMIQSGGILQIKLCCKKKDIIKTVGGELSQQQTDLQSQKSQDVDDPSSLVKD